MFLAALAATGKGWKEDILEIRYISGSNVGL
jgi:hypothetical protein